MRMAIDLLIDNVGASREMRWYRLERCVMGSSHAMHAVRKAMLPSGRLRRQAGPHQQQREQASITAELVEIAGHGQQSWKQQSSAMAAIIASAPATPRRSAPTANIYSSVEIGLRRVTFSRIPSILGCSLKLPIMAP